MDNIFELTSPSQKKKRTIVPNLSEVSSCLSKNLPHPSNSNAIFSTFVPEKSPKQTLNTCRMMCGGTTRNFVKFDKYVIFYNFQ